MQEIRNSNKATNGPQGTVASKTVKSVHLVEKGLNKLRLNVAEVNPTYKIEPEVCLTLQVESQHAVSHFKQPSCTVLEYARYLGNTMHESLKSQCRNTSRISNQFRKIEFWFIPPKQPFGMVISENDIKKSPSALNLDNFRKVRKFTKKYNFYS